MSRKSGSDHLFRLIHSLTPEEKGYFRKFASRHTASGNLNLKLFDAILEQKDFEEKSLRKKFSAYTVMKVYLKDMITDSLVLYHRHHHPHLELLALMQKINILVMKGMEAEAAKLAAKAIKDADEMELFSLSQYISRLKKGIDIKTAQGQEAYRKVREEYSSRMSENTDKESDLQAWELSGLDAFAQIRASDVFNSPKITEQILGTKSRLALSKRSEMIKMQTLYYLCRIEMDQKELLPAAKNYFDAVASFKRKSDSSLNDVASISSQLMTLGTYGHMREAIRLCDAIMARPGYSQMESAELFIRCTIFKLGHIMHLARFEEALELVRGSEKRFRSAIDFTGDNLRLEVFNQKKLICLFLNGKYEAAWQMITEVYPPKKLRPSNIDFGDIRMLEMMIQFKLSNFDLVRTMAVRYRKELTKLKISSFTYQILLDFFSTISSGSYKKEAGRYHDELEEYYNANNKFHRKAFAILRYTYWLDEISGGRTIRKALTAQFAEK